MGRLKLACRDYVGILARQTDGPAAFGIEQRDQFLPDETDHDHLDDLNGPLIGDTETADELLLLAKPFHHLADARPATVNDDHAHADIVQQHEVLRHTVLECGVAHRRAAVLHDHGLAGPLADIGQRLYQRMCPPVAGSLFLPFIHPSHLPGPAIHQRMARPELPVARIIYQWVARPQLPVARIIHSSMGGSA